MPHLIEEDMLQQIIHWRQDNLSGALLLLLLGLLAVGYLFVKLILCMYNGVPSGRRLVTIVAYACTGALMLIGLRTSALWLHARWYDTDRAMIDSYYARFHWCLRQQDFPCAYLGMTPEYRKTHSLEQFRQDFEPFGDDRLELTPRRTLKVWRGTATLRPDRFAPVTFTLIKRGWWWYLTGEYDGMLENWEP